MKPIKTYHSLSESERDLFVLYAVDLKILLIHFKTALLLIIIQPD